MKQDYKIYIWHSNKNTYGLVNRFASNMIILNQAHRAAWIIGQISQVPQPRKGLTDLKIMPPPGWVILTINRCM